MKISFRNPSFFWALIVAPLLISCDDEIPEPVPSAGIEGRVWTQNEFGQPLHDQRSGVNVFLETGFRNFNLAADQVGRYRLPGAPVGTYRATYSKAGFGKMIVSGLRLNTANPAYEVLNGFHQFPSVTLTQLPITDFSNVNVSLQGGGAQGPLTLIVTGTMAPAPPPTGQSKGARIFVRSGNTVSKADYDFQKHFTSNTAQFTIELGAELFGTIPNTTGSVISVRLYGDSNFDESYNDAGLLVFPNLSLAPSQSISVVLP